MELLDAPSRRVVPSAAPVVWAAVASCVIFVPALVALVALARPHWYPTGDMAQAELHVRGLWSHPPLVGAAGRIQDSNGVQGSHPGPALWLAMWPIYALAGSTSFALMVSVTFVHVVTVAGALWLAHRRGGTSLAVLLALSLALIVRAGGPDMVTEPWNPWMGLFPFLVMLLALWSALEDEAWGLVLAVVAGSYCVQTHAGYAVLVAGLCGGVAIIVARRWWRGGERRRLATWFVVALAAGAVVWVPPLVDQLRRDPGNVSILLDSFGNPDAPYLGARRVMEIAIVQFDLLGPWIFGARRDDADLVAVVGCLAFLALWGVAVRSAWHRRAFDELRLHGLLGAAVLLAIVSISRIFGSFFEYTIRWAWVLTATVVAASLWSLWRSRWSRRDSTRASRVVWSRRAVAVIAVCSMAVVSLAVVQFATRARPTGFIDGRIVGGLVPQLVDDLDPSARYLLRWWDPAVLGATGFGTVLELERRGFTVGVDEQFAAAALPHRVQPEQTAASVLYLVLGETSIERARSNPDIVELGAFDVRTPEQRRRSAELRAEIEEALSAAGQADRIPLLDAYYGQAQLLFNEPAPPPDVRRLLGEYIDLRQPAAVFRAAPGTPVLPL